MKSFVILNREFRLSGRLNFFVILFRQLSLIERSDFFVTLNHKLLVLCAIALMVLSVGGCVNEEPAADYGDPTQLDQLTTQGGISIQLLEPADIQNIDDAQVELVLRAWVESDGNREVRVSANPLGGRPIAATVEGEPGPNQRFRIPVNLIHGRNEVEVTVQQIDGPARRVASFPLTYVGDAPGLVILRVGAKTESDLCVGSSTSAVVGTDTACVVGRATANDGTTLDQVRITDASGPRTIEVDATGRFVATASLAINADTVVQFTATDASGGSTSIDVAVTQDSTPPSLTVDTPSALQTITTAQSFTIEGTVAEPDSLSTLQFISSTGGSTSIEIASSWSVNVPLGVGQNELEIVAIDLAGNEARVARNIQRQRVHVLKAPPTERQSTILRLSRSALQELLDEDAQKELLLAEIEIEPFLFEAVTAIRNPVASGIDTSDWGPAQTNFFNLLNLSVDSASLEGTSLGPLADLAYAIGLPTARVLAQVLDVEVTEPALTTEIIVDSLLENLVMTHPNAVTNSAGDPVLRITLFDALNNLEPLADRFGPAPSIGHPGIIGGAISSEVFEPGFLMSANATSNLIQHEGVDASAASKSYIFLLDGDQVLELDVFDDDTFSVVGLVDEPLVDITIAVLESDNFERVGDQRNVDPIPGRPGFFRGNSEIWDLDPWVLEYIVADTVLRRFIDTYSDQGFKASYSFSAGSIENAAEISWDKGWLVVETAGDLGNPPDPQYVWDALAELSQVRLHDGGLSEGQADAIFDLENVPVGIDSEQLIASLRPALDDQQERLSELLLGGSGVLESTSDFYFVPGDNQSSMFLFFRHPSDDGATYGYDNPGFFSDAALTTKVSQTAALSGTTDNIHQKVAVASGDVLFFEDDEGGRYKILVESADPAQLQVLVTPEGAE